MRLSFLSTRLRNYNFALIFIVLLEFMQVVLLIVQHRVVLHDTFYQLIAQYYFLNNVVNTGEIPLWIPYLTQGTAAAYWYSTVGVNGLLGHVLLHTGNLLKNINLLPVFYLIAFFDRLILIVGTWLLSRKLFNSRVTAFLVTVSVVTSSIWVKQTYFNFHIYYTLPLIFYFRHIRLTPVSPRYSIWELWSITLRPCLNLNKIFLLKKHAKNIFIS